MALLEGEHWTEFVRGRPGGRRARVSVRGRSPTHVPQSHTSKHNATVLKPEKELLSSSLEPSDK